MKIIEVTNLTRDYGGGKGIFDLTFSIDKGEVFGFLGPNGAGKTTLIRHLMGFLKPLSGTCNISGMDTRTMSHILQKNIGYLPSEITFFDDMTGKEFFEFLRSYKNIANTEKMTELIKMFELDDSLKINKMSKGTKQKVGIVAAFMVDPEIIILDEPTSGLDPLMQNRFVELIIKEKKKGRTIFISSHDFEEIDRTCDRVAIIKNGKLVTIETLEKLKEKQQKKYTVKFVDDKIAKKFATDYDGTTLDNYVTIAIKNNLNDFIKGLTKYNILDLSVANQNLEDIFMGYYKESQK